MYKCDIIYKVSGSTRNHFQMNISCTPESIPREILEKHIQDARGYKRPITIEEYVWVKVKDDPLNMSKVDFGDINMPNTQIESIRNGVAERMAHGLNANEILRDLIKITRPELIRVIMDLIENPVQEDEGSNIDPPKLDERQLATVLYGLRYIEQTYNSSGYVHCEHIEGLEPMNQMEINRLCEDINLGRITL